MTTGATRCPTPESLGDLERAAAVRGGQRPFMTFYDDATGERTELGHATTRNWVSKTANLLAGELGLEPGRVLAVRLGTHWTAAVVLLAAWRCGAVVRRDAGPPWPGPHGAAGLDGADALVVGESAAAALAEPHRALVVGDGLGGRVLGDAGGALAFGEEVLTCDDEFDDPPIGREHPALAETDPAAAGEGRAPLTHGDLLDLASATAGALELRPGRRLLLGYGLETLEGVAVTLAALAADTSIVLVARGDPDAEAGRVASERCDLVVRPAAGAGGAVGDIPARGLAVARGAAGGIAGVRATG